MAANSKAIKEAEELRISQIGDFKRRLGGIQELPSGLVVKLRNPGGLRAFLGNGTIPNSLTGIIQKSLKSGKGMAAEDILDSDGGFDPNMLSEVMEMMDSIAMRVIVEPKIHPTPTEEMLIKWNKDNPSELLYDVDELRNDEELYVDELPDDDKQFIFQWISGGTRDLETFRKELDSNVVTMATVSSTKSGAKSGNGTNKR